MKAGVKIIKLNNGLRVVLAPVMGLSSVTVLTLVGAGTRYETVANNGISHFLEHMVFKGTKEYPSAADISRAIDEVGGVFNAFTGKEYTGFYVKTGTDHLDFGLKMVSQLVFEPILPKKEMEIERGVILEEIRMYEDQPQVKVGQVFEEVVFKGSTLAWDTLGTEEIIRKVKIEDFRNYMDYLYSPNRMVLVIAGGLGEIETLEDKVETYFGKKKDIVKLNMEKFEFKQKKRALKQIIKKTEQTHMLYGFRTFGRGDQRRYILAVLSTILGGGMSSRFFEEIREKKGLAYYVSASVENYIEDGYLAMNAGTNPKMAGKVLKIAQEEFEKIKTKKVPSKELNKAKEYIKGHLKLSMEDSYHLAGFYAEDLLMENKIRSLDEVLKGINQVTAEEVRSLAAEIFTEEKSNLALIGPLKII